MTEKGFEQMWPSSVPGAILLQQEMVIKYERIYIYIYRDLMIYTCYILEIGLVNQEHVNQII